MNFFSLYNIFIIVFILIFYPVHFLNAKDFDLKKIDITDKEQRIEIANKEREKLKKKIDLTIDRINDYFFKDSDYGIELKDEIKIRSEFLQNKDAHPKFNLKLNVNMNFPSFSFVLDNYKKDRLPGTGLDNKVTEVSAGLKHYLYKLKKSDLSFGYGLKIRDEKPIAYSRAKWIKRSIEFDNWVLHISQSVFWYSDNGLGELSLTDLDYNINQDIFLRSTFGALYSKTSNGFELEQSFIFSYDIEEKGENVFARISGFAHTMPEFYIDKYETNIIYRIQLVEPWLFFDIAPQVIFPAGKNFIPIPGIQLGMDAFF